MPSYRMILITVWAPEASNQEASRWTAHMRRSSVRACLIPSWQTSLGSHTEWMSVNCEVSNVNLMLSEDLFFKMYIVLTWSWEEVLMLKWCSLYCHYPVQVLRRLCKTEASAIFDYNIRWLRHTFLHIGAATVSSLVVVSTMMRSF